MLRSHKKLTKKELKQDKLVLLTAEVVDYLHTEWVKIATIVGGVIVVVAIAFLIVGGVRRSDQKAYDAAIRAYYNNAPEALDLLKRYVDAHGSSKRAGNFIINIAGAAFAQKDYATATTYFTMLIKKFGTDPVLSFSGYSGLGAVLEQQNDFAKAAQTYEEFITKHADTPFIPPMILNAGKAHYLAGNREAARQMFDRIKTEFPQSSERTEADYYLELLSVASAGN